MAEDLPQTLQEMDRLETNPLLFFLSSVMVRGEPQQEKALTAPWRLPSLIRRRSSADVSTRFEVQRASSAIFLLLAVCTSTGETGMLEGPGRLSKGSDFLMKRFRL